MEARGRVGPGNHITKEVVEGPAYAWPGEEVTCGKTGENVSHEKKILISNFFPVCS